MKRLNNYSLYLVIGEEYANGRNLADIACSAISGGIDILQLREKGRPRDQLLDIAVMLSGICKDKGVTFIVNDDPDLARAVNADGVHVGQEDILQTPLSEIRDTVGVDRLIGLSTHSLRQFRAANDSCVDYVSFGPIFPTKTKDYFIGSGDVESILKVARKPVVFIGGINLSNMDELLEKGARIIGLIRAIAQADDIAQAAKSFKDKLISQKKRR